MLYSNFVESNVAFDVMMMFNCKDANSLDVFPGRINFPRIHLGLGMHEQDLLHLLRSQKWAA